MKKERAYRIVRTAIKNGSLVRPDECQKCGERPPPTSDGRAAIQAHHHDHSKPLEVEWVCAKCHRLETPVPMGPGPSLFGSQNHQARLNEKSVAAIKRLRASGLTQRAIAKQFGVNKSTVARVIDGTHWGYVSAAPNGDKR